MLHIAVIMDGNGRWALSRGQKRSAGHRAGTETIERLLDHLLKIKIPCVSLYAFSTENWKRPHNEITAIFKLLDEFIETRLQKLIDQGVKIVTSGDISRLPKKSRGLLNDAVLKTKRGKKLTANFCLNYGARDEIHRAALLYATTSPKAKSGKLPTEKEFSRYLWQPRLPDVDLLIRTAGEFRLSNFMLYQSAYAELYFTDKTWPEFTEQDLDAAIAEFKRRKRKFGGL
ncbi:MAG TPA: polyprenyl diphosphate synthase [Turneriella sp.]|nr:polyprenyl diphosphate synthase [Turneriella sp.]